MIPVATAVVRTAGEIAPAIFTISSDFCFVFGACNGFIEVIYIS
jgi:hypothetical protein